MKGNIKYFLAFLAIFFSGQNVFSGDGFEAIKDRIAAADLINLDVDIVVLSKIFDEIDTTSGNILIADDGRYKARLNDDIYLFDGKVYWEYSAENNQATRRIRNDADPDNSRLAFFKNIDKYYESKILKPDSIYALIKLKSSDEALPESLAVFLNDDASKVALIEYYDLNNELNQVIIKNESYLDNFDDSLFNFDLPDSVEIITLP